MLPDTVTCECFLGGTIDLPRERLRIRPAAYGLIVHGGRVVRLANRHTDRLSLPGGGVEAGERLVDALQREIREEAGLAVRVERLAAFREAFFYYDPGDMAFHSLLFFFHCAPLTFDLLPDDRVDDEESIRPRWVALAGLRPADFQTQGDLMASLLGLPGARPLEPLNG